MMELAERRPLTVAELESQAAMELPDREMMLVTVVITNVLNDLTVDVDVRNIAVALQVCAIVSDVNAILVDDAGDSVAVLTCDIDATGLGGPGN